MQAKFVRRTFNRVTKFIVVSLLKFMSQKQYVRMLEKEIQKINKRIDLKILQGEKYSKEARDHKLLLQKVRYNTRKSFMQRVIHLFFRRPIMYA